MEPLETIVTLFVRREKQARILALQAARRRGALIDALLHDRRSLNPGVLKPLNAVVTAEAIHHALRAGGAGEAAYCWSTILQVDNRTCPLSEALAAVVGRAEDCLVYPLGARVAYYENHEGERFLLASSPLSQARRKA